MGHEGMVEFQALGRHGRWPCGTCLRHRGGGTLVRHLRRAALEVALLASRVESTHQSVLVATSCTVEAVAPRRRGAERATVAVASVAPGAGSQLGHAAATLQGALRARNPSRDPQPAATALSRRGPSSLAAVARAWREGSRPCAAAIGLDHAVWSTMATDGGPLRGRVRCRCDRGDQG